MVSSHLKVHRSASDTSCKVNTAVTKKLSPKANCTVVNTPNQVVPKSPQTTHLHPVKTTAKNGVSDSQKVDTKSSGDTDKSQATETTQSPQVKKPEQLLVALPKSATSVVIPEEKNGVVEQVSSEPEKNSSEVNSASTKASDHSQDYSRVDSSVQVKSTDKSTEQPRESVDTSSNPKSEAASAKNEESGSEKTQDTRYVIYSFNDI